MAWISFDLTDPQGVAKLKEWINNDPHAKRQAESNTIDVDYEEVKPKQIESHDTKEGNVDNDKQTHSS